MFDGLRKDNWYKINLKIILEKLIAGYEKKAKFL